MFFGANVCELNKDQGKKKETDISRYCFLCAEICMTSKVFKSEAISLKKERNIETDPGNTIDMKPSCR